MLDQQTTFDAPAGEEPVALDLGSMGKGQAWVNGEHIGRFWPSMRAPQWGCSQCDYRGAYNPDKCLTNCGEPSQRWQVPSFTPGTVWSSLANFKEFFLCFRSWQTFPDIAGITSPVLGCNRRAIYWSFLRKLEGIHCKYQLWHGHKMLYVVMSQSWTHHHLMKPGSATTTPHQQLPHCSLLVQQDTT